MNYRIEGQVIDAAGHAVHVVEEFAVTDDPVLIHGPTVTDLNIAPNSVAYGGVGQVEITFSGQLDLSTLSPDNVRLRHSVNATFFDGDDVFVADADGMIAWDPVRQIATFDPEGDLASGFYLLETNGGASGIRSAAGRLLDGEYLDTGIAGNTTASIWQGGPSGDGIPGGDYRAMFQVFDSFDYGDAPSPYRTLRADDGARHAATGPQLGDPRDVESNGQPGTNADGDSDDEDGVMFGGIYVGNTMAGINIAIHRVFFFAGFVQRIAPGPGRDAHGGRGRPRATFSVGSPKPSSIREPPGGRSSTSRLTATASSSTSRPSSPTGSR